MSDFNQFVFKIFMALFLLSSNLNGQEISKQDFIKLASTYIGQYELIEKNNDFCRSGDLSFVDSKIPNKGLVLSNKLFFGPFEKSGKDTKEDGYCTINETYQYSKSLLRQTTKVHKCEKENISDEGISTQELHFRENKIIYKSVESKINCTFKRINNGEKR